MVLCYRSPSKLMQSQYSVKSINIYLAFTVCRACTKFWGARKRNLSTLFELTIHLREQSHVMDAGAKSQKWLKSNRANFMSRAIKMEVNPGLNDPKWILIKFVIFFGALIIIFTCAYIYFSYSRC